jgi:hypothetical protein
MMDISISCYIVWEVLMNGKTARCRQIKDRFAC